MTLFLGSPPQYVREAEKAMRYPRIAKKCISDIVRRKNLLSYSK